MARHVGRSKGCSTCRQKRIKCDEKIPQCSQCLASGLKCPGAVVGNIFLDQSSETVGRQKRPHSTRPRNKTTARIEKDCPTDLPTNNGSEKVISRISLKSASESIVGASRFPEGEKSTTSKKNSVYVEMMPSHISPNSALKEYLLGNFIECLTKTPGSPVLKRWLPYVPVLINQNASPTLQFAAYAASMVLFGSVTKNYAVQKEGYRWYGMGLRNQKSQLVTLTQNQNLEDISDAKICGTLFLSFFEMSCGTTSEAWKSHICASARLIQLRGAGTFKDNLPHELFRAVRLAMVYLTTENREPTFLSSQDWLTVPFAGNQKTKFDELVDISLSIPTVLGMADRIVDGERMLDGICNLNLGLLLEGLAAALDDWANRHELEQHCKGTASCTSATAFIRFQDPFTAETISLYDSSCILISAARKALAACGQKSLLDQQIKNHSISIFTAVESIERNNVWNNAGGPFRLVHPLKIVATSSPCDGQVAVARSILDRWSTQYGMEGICKLNRE